MTGWRIGFMGGSRGFAQFWSSCYRKYAIKLNKVQRRFRKIFLALESLNYTERLSRLGLYSLEHMRMRCDLTELYKFIRGYSRTRGYRFNLRGNKYNRTPTGNFFTQRVIWKKLLKEVVEVEYFKLCEQVHG